MKELYVASNELIVLPENIDAMKGMHTKLLGTLDSTNLLSPHPLPPSLSAGAS